MVGICPRQATDEGTETSSWVPQVTRQGREGAGTQMHWTFPAFFSVSVNILPETISTMYRQPQQAAWTVIDIYFPVPKALSRWAVSSQFTREDAEAWKSEF